MLCALRVNRDLDLNSKKFLLCGTLLELIKRRYRSILYEDTGIDKEQTN